MDQYYFELEERDIDDDSVTQQEVMDSWELIFNIDDLKEHPNWGECTLQGVTDTIHVNDITLIKTFMAR